MVQAVQVAVVLVVLAQMMERLQPQILAVGAVEAVATSLRLAAQAQTVVAVS